MSTFYVLPGRRLVEETFAEYLGALLPGLPRATIQASMLTELLESGTLLPSDVFVVFREDLPEEDDLLRALADGFGAEAGDEIVEVPAVGGRRAESIPVEPLPEAA